MAAGPVAELLQERGQAPSQGTGGQAGHTPVAADRLFPHVFLNERLEINGNENTPGSQSITKPVPEPQSLRLPPSDGGTVEKEEAQGCRVKTQDKNP